MTTPTPTLPTITPTSRIRLRELVVTRDSGTPLIGCLDQRRFLEVDETTLEVVEILKQDLTLEEADKVVQERTGTDYDLVEFAQFLAERGFVESVDGQSLPGAEPPNTRALFGWVKPHHVTWLRAPPMLALYALVILWYVVLAAVEPRFRPSSEALAITSSPALNLVLDFAILLLFTIGHELAHFFVAKSYGVDSPIKLSHRFYVLVLQTDVTNAWTLPVRQRIAIFLAGVTFNALLVATCGALLAAGYIGIVDLGETLPSLLSLSLYLNMFPIVFQLFVFARTDFYFVLMSFAKQRNLTQDTKAYLLFSCKRAFRWLVNRERVTCDGCGKRAVRGDPFCLRCGQEMSWTDTDATERYQFQFRGHRFLAVYGVVFVLGSLFGMWFFLTFALFVLPNFLQMALVNVKAGWAFQRPGLILQGLLVLVIMVAQLAFVGRSLYRMGFDYVWRPLVWVGYRVYRWLRPSAAAAPTGAPEGEAQGRSG